MVEAVARPQRDRVIEAVAYLLAIAAVEAVTIFLHPLWGMVGHVIIMVTIIARSALTSDKSHQRLVLPLALVPLIRVMDLSMPLIPVDPTLRFVIIYVPLLVASIVVVRILGYRRGEVGLNFKSLPLQLGVASTGLFFGWVEYLILKPESAMIPQLTWSQVLPVALILMASTGFVEEFAFRGVLQRGAVESFGWRGVVYVSLLFAIMHMGFRSWLDVVFVFGVAMFFGWIVKKTGSIFGVTLSHGITNIVLFLIVPFYY